MKRVAPKELTLDFSKYSFGLNTKENQFVIKSGQAFNGSINARFNSGGGFGRAPGFFGLSETPLFTTYCKCLEYYSRTDGTQKLMGLSGGRLYEIAGSGTKTERYNIGGLGEGYGCSAYDKYFIANGSGSCFVSNETGYQIGITPPTACTVAAAAGGTLPDGVYTIYVSYAINNSLYSQGFLCSTVTLGSGNNSIAFSSFANSSNARVSNKVVWMIGPSDSGTVYFYYQTNDNTSVTFTISSASTKDTSKLYRTLALPSKTPPAMSGLYFHDDRLFGWKDNVLHASMKAVSVYDLERWPDIQYTFPYYILSLFNIGTDLYINTNQGILVLPDGDMTARYWQKTKRLYYKYVRTVSKLDDTTGNEKESPVIGWTNDGARIFDGNGFSIDLSKDIKPDIQQAMNDASSVFQPCGFVCRSKDRSEYRISYRDTRINATHNNRQMVLNLDTLTIQNNTEYLAAWEMWEIGFSHVAISQENTITMAQSLNGNSQVMYETFGSVANKWVYGDSGYISTLTPKKICVISKCELLDLAGRFDCEQIRTLTQLAHEAKITIYIGDEFSISDSRNITPSGGDIALFDEALFDEATFTTEQPTIGVGKLKQNLKGASCYIVFEQTADDPSMNVIMINLYINYQQGRMI